MKGLAPVTFRETGARVQVVGVEGQTLTAGIAERPDVAPPPMDCSRFGAQFSALMIGPGCVWLATESMSEPKGDAGRRQSG